MAGAPLGNKNAAKPRIWQQAIERALETRTKSRIDGKKEIDALAEKLLDAVASGDLAALKEFGDRIDGKPAQQVQVSGDPDAPLHTHSKVELVSL